MSTALYIILDIEETGFDTFVNGKAMAHAADDLTPVCAGLRLPPVDHYVSLSGDEVSDIMDEDFELPEPTWFAAAEGVKYFEALARHLRATPDLIDNQDAVVDDLDEYVNVLLKAQAIGARWRLSLDI